MTAADQYAAALTPFLENGSAVTSPITPQAMLGMAVARGDTELAAKLMDLVERWETRTARKAFDTAIAAAKAKIPVIFKNREMSAGSGRTSYRYEDMAAIARAIDPVLSEHGLGYRFRTNTKDSAVSVTCIIFHEGGHAEENTLSGAADTSGSKNAIQALGSALTYLQRYSLKAALGLAASADDDGNGGNGNGSQTISDEQYRTLAKLIADAGADVTLFLNYFKASSLADFPANKFQSAVDALNAKRAKK